MNVKKNIFGFFRRHKILGISLGLFFLIFAVFFFLHTPPGRRLIFSQVQEILSNRFEMQLNADSIRFNFLTLSASIDSLTLEAQNNNFPLKYASAEYIRVNIGIRTILSGQFHFQNIQIDHPNVILQPTTSEKRPEKPGKARRPLRLRIDNLNLIQGNIDFNGQSLPVQAGLSRIRVDIHYDPAENIHDGRISAESGILGLQGPQFPIDHILLPFRFNNTFFDIRNLQVDSPAITFAASGEIHDYQNDPKFDIGFSAAVRSNILSESLHSTHSFHGILELEGRVFSAANGPEMEGQLSADNLNAFGIPFSSIRADISYQPARLNLSRLRLQSPYGKLSAEGIWHMRAAGLSRITINWDNLQPGRILSQIRSQPFPVSFVSRGSIQAEWNQLKKHDLKANLETEFGSNKEADISSDVFGRIRAEWNQGNAHLYPSHLAFPGGEFQINGKMDAEQLIQAHMDLTVSDLAAAAQRLPEELFPEPVNGGFQLAADINGTPSQPQISAELTSNGLYYRNISLSQAKADISAGPKSLRINECFLQTEEGHLELTGKINSGFPEFSPAASSRLYLSVSSLALGPFLRSFSSDIPLEGTLDGTSILTGSLTNPHIKLDLTGSPLKIAEETIGSLLIQGTYKPDLYSLSAFEIKKNTARLSGSGQWNPGTETFELEVNGSEIQVQDFSFLQPDSEAYTGNIDFHIHAGGPLVRPAGRMNLNITNAKAGEIRIGSVRLDAHSDGDNLEAEMNLADDSLQLSASMPLESPYQIQARCKISQWNAGAHLPPKPGSQGPMPPFSTLVTGAAKMTIPLNNPLLLSGDFNMNSFRFAYRGIQFTLPRPISISAEKGIVAIRDFTFSGPETEIKVSGRFPLSGEPQQGISLSGRLNLHAFEPFIPGGQLGGHIDLSTSVSGNLNNPIFAGRIRLEDAEAGFSGFPFTLEKAAGRIILDSGIIRLENFSGGIGEGKFYAAGQLNIPGLSAIAPPHGKNQLDIRWAGLNPSAFDRYLPPEYSGRLQGDISGNASISGDFSSLASISIQGRFSRFRMELTPFEMAAENDILFSMSNGCFQLQPMHLTGSQSAIRAQGILDFQQENPRLASSLSVSLDGGALSPLIESALFSGTAVLDLALNGPADNPVITGQGTLKDFYLQLQSLPLTISNIEGDIRFSESHIDISSIKGSANGGPVSLGGRIQYSHFNPEQVNLDVNFQQLQWNYPEGLNSFNQGGLGLNYSGGEWTLAGDIRIQQAYFKKDVYIGTELVNQIRLNRVRMQTEMPDFLKQLNLDIQIQTEGEAVLDNNLAELGLAANLIIKGSPLDPVFSGLISNPFSGEITFFERTFQVETARIDFPGADILDARINITAFTSMQVGPELQEIKLTVNGPLTDLSTSLTSSPDPYSEIELAALLITGRNIQDLKSSTANAIGNQLLLYFASPLSSSVTGHIEDWLHVEEFRIEPINIATEEDPGARFTFRKGLIQNVDLIYSVDITDTQDQTWILEYDLSRNFIIKALRKDDGSYSSSLEHRFEVGKPNYSQLQASESFRRNILESIRFSGTLIFNADTVRKELGALKTGKIFNYSDLQSAVDRLSEFYSSRNYLNAVINPQISYEDGNKIQINIHVEGGMPVLLDYPGDTISNSIKNTIRNSWDGRLPETARISEAVQQILSRLKGKGYYQAKVTHKKSVNSGLIQHTFSISRGAKFEIGQFVIEGGSGVSNKEILKAVKNLPESEKLGLWNLVQNFRRSREQLEKLYEEQGYMHARVFPPRIKVRSARQKLDITLPIEQGARSRVKQLDFQGLDVFTPEILQKSLNLNPGQIFRPSQLAMDISHLIDLYRSRGFQNVEITAGLEYLENNAGVSLAYTIDEGMIHHIKDILISGNRRTPEKVIRRELVFTKGEPVVQSQIVESQKNLYNLNIFELVNIQRKKIPDQPGQEQILVEVREMPLFYLGYGLRYDSDDNLEGFGDVEFKNLFGRSRNGILFYRQNQWEKNFRFSLSDPYFFGLPINTLHSFSLLNEKRSGVITDEFGYTVEQQLQLPLSLRLSYLYRLSHIHTYDEEASGPFAFDISWWLSEVSTHLIRDTRSDKLNARTGSFFSLSLTYSPSFLGSSFTYIRGFGQYSLFLPLLDKLTWASNIRIGLIDTFEQGSILYSKRYFAGGGNSIRGFEKDQVGPYSYYLERPQGGHALFIINQELRFPVYKSFSGVVFFDAGNVYPFIEDFQPWELRTSAGCGLRFNSPIGLLRLDYGINLNPKDREPRGVLFFSIGQSF